MVTVSLEGIGESRMLITTDELSKTIWNLILQEINPDTRKILKSMSYKDPEFEQGFIQGLTWASIAAITTKPAEYKDFAELMKLYRRINTDWNSPKDRLPENDTEVFFVVQIYSGGENYATLPLTGYFLDGKFYDNQDTEYDYTPWDGKSTVNVVEYWLPQPPLPLEKNK